MTRMRLFWLTAALVVAGCSSTPEASDTPPSVNSTTVTVAPTTAPAPPPEPSTTYSATFLYESKDGHKAEMHFRLEGLERATTNKVYGTATLGRACPINNQTDVVVPFYLEVKNTTPSQTLTLTARWFTIRPLRADTTTVELFTEQQGGECTGEGVLQLSNITATLSPGQRVVSSGFFIARNYYAPNRSDGRAEHVRNALIVPYLMSVKGTSSTLTQKSAQTALLYQHTGPLYAMPWNPVNTDGGCLITGNACQ